VARRRGVGDVRGQARVVLDADAAVHPIPAGDRHRRNADALARSGSRGPASHELWRREACDRSGARGGNMTRRPPFYGLLAEFESPADLLRAAHAARQEGYRRMDAYSPFPIEGLAEALGFHRTGLPLLIFVGGLVGCIGGFFMQYYAAVHGYPVNIGGRPLNSWPAFLPITFELTVLVAGLTAVLGLLGLN